MATETLDHHDPVARVAATSSPVHQRVPRWVLLVVAALCVLALVVRALVAGNSGLWRDEALFLFVVDQPSFGAILDFLRQHESHPPLFYAVMRVWLSLVGDSDPAALAVPVALGGALVPAVYYVGARLLSWRVGLLAAALATVSPVLVQYGAMVRPYSLLPLLTLAGTYALVRVVDLGGWHRWVGYAAAMLALVYTHNWGWLVLAAHWLALVACLWRGTARPATAILREWAGAQGAIVTGFLPWLPCFVQQAAHAGHTPSPLLRAIDSPLDLLLVAMFLVPVLLGGTFVPAGINAAASAVAFWGLGVNLLALLLRRPAPAPVASVRCASAGTVMTVLVVVPGAAAAAALVLSPRSDLFLPYCLATVAPLLLLLVAHGFVRLGSNGRRRLALAGGASVLAAYAALLGSLYQTPRSNARELAGTLSEDADQSDLILVLHGWLASSINRYYTPDTEQIDFPAPGRIGAMPFDHAARRIADPAALASAERRLDASRAAGRRVWLVFDAKASICIKTTCGTATIDPDNAGDMAAVRATQLRAYVTRLYGAPVTCDTTSYTAGWDEKFGLCLYAPH